MPSSPVTEVFPKQCVSIIMGCFQAQLGEEERDVCLADSFIGKCLFRVGPFCLASSPPRLPF